MVILVAFVAASTAIAEPPPPPPPPEVLRGWVEEMKQSPRGPFERLRWFCKDGTVHPPRPYPCEERGGGVQHGEWTERVVAMRAGGYAIANFLADLEPQAFVGANADVDGLASILVERFLISADDGWILRGARTYRGALQAEDEERSARAIVLAMLADAAWQKGGRYLLLREAVRLLPVYADQRSAEQVRRLASEIARADADFFPLRAKIHGFPEAADADAVRDYAGRRGQKRLADRYEELAMAIDGLYASREVAPALLALAQEVSDPALAGELRESSTQLSAGAPQQRLSRSCRLLADLRDALPGEPKAEVALQILATTFDLEREVYAAGNTVLAEVGALSRRQRLGLVGDSARALYGAGFLGRRELAAALESIGRLGGERISVAAYRSELRYLARAPEWASRRLGFYFSPALERLAPIEPLAQQYPQDRLRAGPALLYGRIVDGLMLDANRLAGIEHDFFGQRIGMGLRALNPGLARGVLHVSGEAPVRLDSAGIHLLPETVSDLPPVSGILTRGEGSSLSHVQLLARNLGVPNVVVSEALVPALRARAERSVVLAVSPNGVVLIAPDGPQWTEVFGQSSPDDDLHIRPDVEKLDLERLDLVPLSRLRAGDSGRLCGPKGAKLGELKHLFGDAVPDGFVVPFGAFRRMLDRPLENGGPSVWSSMRERYRRAAALPPHERTALIADLLARLRDWIESADLGPELNARLLSALRRKFGSDGTYGVFVRSDTNVEDLPGFTGAGLNLTVPNVVGEEEIADALRRVWASPFTERSYGWRQAHMDEPEYVFPAVVVQRAFDSEKSGVMVTTDLERGEPGWISVATNEGVGGAVEGQNAEALRIEVSTGKVQLLAEAAAPWRTVLSPLGGVDRLRASGEDVLADAEIAQLVAFAKELPERFRSLRDDDGRPAAADVEFAFRDGRLTLLQIRPLVESRAARRNRYLAALDAGLPARADRPVKLDETPEGTR